MIWSKKLTLKESVVTWEDRREEVGDICFLKPETFMGVQAGRGMKPLDRAEP